MAEAAWHGRFWLRLHCNVFWAHSSTMVPDPSLIFYRCNMAHPTQVLSRAWVFGEPLACTLHLTRSAAEEILPVVPAAANSVVQTHKAQHIFIKEYTLSCSIEIPERHRF